MESGSAGPTPVFITLVVFARHCSLSLSPSLSPSAPTPSPNNNNTRSFPSCAACCAPLVVPWTSPEFVDHCCGVLPAPFLPLPVPVSLLRFSGKQRRRRRRSDCLRLGLTRVWTLLKFLVSVVVSDFSFDGLVASNVVNACLCVCVCVCVSLFPYASERVLDPWIFIYLFIFLLRVTSAAPASHLLSGGGAGPVSCTVGSLTPALNEPTIRFSRSFCVWKRATE